MTTPDEPIGIMHLGYDDRQVLLSPQRPILKWIYVREPPHGDGIFKVELDAKDIPGEFWGRNLFWSQSGAYVTLERKLPHKSELLLLDMKSGELHWIADNCAAVHVTETNVAFKPYGRSEIQTKEISAVLGTDPR